MAREFSERDIQDLAKSIERDQRELHRIELEERRLENQYKEAERKYNDTKERLEASKREKETIATRLTGLQKSFEEMHRAIDRIQRSVK